ncbi:MAG: DUF2828 family protein [Ruminococcaceae bacterium]|nr:DUF2828 family protein [Oscillospiraceae bacterium]
MLEYLKKEANMTVTENGAATHLTTESDCLDLFATIGALRRESDGEIITRFIRAYSENRDIAMKLLFFARDIRGGLGERRVFKVILNWLANNEPEAVRKNLAYVAEYGRYDDLLCLMGTNCEKEMLGILKAQFDADNEALENGGEVSLLAKWLPSVNASNKETVFYAKRIARHFGISDASYRKALVALRAHIRIIENNLRNKDYSFDYEKQPSKAMYKYRKAFIRNDAERYNTFIGKVSNGEAKLNADTLAPYELVAPYINGSAYASISRSFMRQISEQEKNVLNTTWASLPDFGNEENAIAVIDTSGSMYWDAKPIPAAVALSLGLYFAEHNTGLYKNHFIEFSARPQLIEIKGDTFADRLRYVASFNEVANTNLEAVFDLILTSAVKNNVPASELPAKLIIISDMEFDSCVSNAGSTNFKKAKAKFEAHGYNLPDIVFWNVASRNRQQPVTKNEQGVALVSGCTPRLFEMVASGTMNPYAFMLEVVESERYAKIVA